LATAGICTLLALGSVWRNLCCNAIFRLPLGKTVWPQGFLRVPQGGRAKLCAIISEAHPARGGAPLTKPVELIGFALIVGQLVYLIGSYLQGSWLVAPGSGAIPTDFVDVWAAGQLVLQGNPAAVYD
jgi:predicted acyltransferase